MNQDECIRLIQFYQTYRFLWDAKDKAYHNKRKREDAWKEMSIKMELPVDSLKAKMKTLMGSYRSEKSREKKSRVTGSGSEDVYESKWFAYKYFDFVCDRDKPRETQDTENEEIPEEEASAEIITNPTQPATSSVTAAVTTSADESQVSTVRCSSTSRMQKTGMKRKAAEENSDSRVMGEALKLLQTSVNNGNDPYYTYSLNLANELKKYDQYTLAHVKRAFSNILFEADLGLFSAPTPHCSTVQPHHIPATSNPTDTASTSRGYFTHTSSTTPSPLQSPPLHELHQTSQFDCNSNSSASYSTLSSAQNCEEGTSRNTIEEDIDVTSFIFKSLN